MPLGPFNASSSRESDEVVVEDRRVRAQAVGWKGELVWRCYECIGYCSVIDPPHAANSRSQSNFRGADEVGVETETERHW